MPGQAVTRCTRTRGSTPAAIDAVLREADAWGLQVALHSDFAERGRLCRVHLAAFPGRSISGFHVGGAGGGHSPDIATLAVRRQAHEGSREGADALF